MASHWMLVSDESMLLLGKWTCDELEKILNRVEFKCNRDFCGWENRTLTFVHGAKTFYVDAEEAKTLTITSMNFSECHHSPFQEIATDVDPILPKQLLLVQEIGLKKPKISLQWSRMGRAKSTPAEDEDILPNLIHNAPENLDDIKY